MGPSKDAAYERADKYVDAFIKLLDENERMSEKAIDGPMSWDKLNLIEYRTNVEKLRTAVREMFWISDAASF